MRATLQEYLTLEKRLLAIQEKYPDGEENNPLWFEEQELADRLAYIWYDLSEEEQEVIVKEHHIRIGKFCEEREILY